MTPTVPHEKSGRSGKYSTTDQNNQAAKSRGMNQTCAKPDVALLTLAGFVAKKKVQKNISGVGMILKRDLFSPMGVQESIAHERREDNRCDQVCSGWARTIACRKKKSHSSSSHLLRGENVAAILTCREQC